MHQVMERSESSFYIAGPRYIGAVMKLGVTKFTTRSVSPRGEISLPPNDFCNRKTQSIATPVPEFDFVFLYLLKETVDFVK